MNVLSLPLATHLSFIIPQLRSDRPCVICLGPKPDLACERCATMMHFDCHFANVATEDERYRFLTVPADTPGVTPSLFLCQGCRS